MNLKKVLRCSNSRMISDGVNEDIKRYKKSLIAKAKKNGIYEDFGQKEVRALQDKYGYTADVSNFDNWCMDFDMSCISDSCRVKDSYDEEEDNYSIDLEIIGDLLEDGYHSGYDPQWSINATIDGTSLYDYGLSTEDIDLVYRDIAYCVKGGNENYYGLEVELENGDTVYVDYEIEY